MLWLSAKSLRDLLYQTSATAAPNDKRLVNYYAKFAQGAALHLLNPKAVMVWLAIISLALPPPIQSGQALIVVLGCALIGMGVFGSYAVLFSLPGIRVIYLRLRSWFEAALTVIFGYAGYRMLHSIVADI